MDRESASIKNELLRISWWMRGSITLEQAYQLSYKDRSMISDLIKENMEASKKAGVPIF